MKQALEALEEIVKWYGVRDKNDVMMPPLNQNPEIKESMDAITVLRQAIEQAEKQEPVIVDLATMELAESVGLIGPASRTHDLHNAIQRFHDLICANATIKAAVAFSRTKE